MDEPSWTDVMTALSAQDADLADGVLRTDEAEIGVLASPSSEVWTVWPCCVLYAGQPHQDVPVAAPSADIALASLGALVDRANRQAAAMGYPAVFSAAAGPCSR